MLIALLVLDAIWIASFMQGLYQQEIPGLLKEQADIAAALAFYLGYPLGAWYLAVLPAVRMQSLKAAVSSGAVLGAVAYGTFAVTNLAVLAGWSVTLTVADLVWGACVTAAVSALGYKVAS